VLRRLPRDVYVLQAGLLVNAFGNGAAGPFLVLYLHDVRGIPLGLAGLVPAVNASVALCTALVAGSIADKRGSRPTMVIGLCCSSLAFVLYPFVHEAWQAFPLAVLGGIGGGTWLTGQSSLLAAITPQELRHVAFAQQRVVANVGLGLGGFAGGILVTVAEPETFTRLFRGNAVTFLVYAVVLLLGVREPIRARVTPDAPKASYRQVARDGAFMRFAAVHFVYVLSTVSLLNAVFPVFARNQAGLSEDEIGAMFLLNSLLIVLFQLPVARALEGHRRMRGFALIGVLFALCWSLVLAGGLTEPALGLIAAGIAAMSIGECIYDTIQGPLAAQLAPPDVLGRYMAVMGFVWQAGFIGGPALGAAILGAAPYALWPLTIALSLAGAAYSLVLERHLPEEARWTTRLGEARRGRRTAAPTAAEAVRRR
jgi:MFS family permease